MALFGDLPDILREITSHCAMREILVLCNVSRRHRMAMIAIHAQRMRRYAERMDTIANYFTTLQTLPKRIPNPCVARDCIRQRNRAQLIARNKAPQSVMDVLLLNDIWINAATAFLGICCSVVTIVAHRYFQGAWKIPNGPVMAYFLVASTAIDRLVFYALTFVESPRMSRLVISVADGVTFLGWLVHLRCIGFSFAALAGSSRNFVIGMTLVYLYGVPFSLMQATSSEGTVRNRIHPSLQKVRVQTMQRLWDNAEWDLSSNRITQL